jgi:hypothetical protein
MDNLASPKVSGIARYFAALHFGRYWHTAAVNQGALCPQLARADIRPVDGNSGCDPLRKLGGAKCCDAQRAFFNSVLGCNPRIEG